ncbi:potassium uptake protein KtrC [Alkalihalophilus pseudofirmus OF4]|uniref:Potassium uptake protein KtrC n=2 Tax=Alkalihalophilus pseudofirmus TaxID=79885 RepID=D3FU88_ALKPO|nr:MULTISPECIES: TrkA family potassium uptake protein [Alkalihalophilus]ADC48290.1 potassium uptake protein KtrC [Alkalihalophilus pseudofirmus OF4]MDV2885452.1 TrkA family potassium uptake protein [Alkalihalophilus pseudofirmus]MED1602109.1 TrkA family potassium uptake protein [Alkalihalophilus marmarensis]WEG15790.1 TrkA family potassium uptake protein [Alkalihalophilus pseudofirmus]
MKRQFAVIGLGRFGGSVCCALIEQGVEVLAIDQCEAKVNQYRDVVTHAVVADSTDEQALRHLGIRNFEHVIVAIGDNIQASILTTLILDELGVEHITVKAQNDYHEKVLVKIGAERIVHPERDMGARIAHHLMSKNVLDYLEVSDKYSIIEMFAGSKMHAKTLVELNVRASFGCNVMAIKRGAEMIVSPKADQLIQQDDLLIVLGADEDIKRFEQMFDDTK